MRRPQKPNFRTFLTLQALILIFLYWSSPVLGISQSASFVQEDDSIKLIPELVYTVKLIDLRVENPASGVQFYQDGIIYLIDTKNDPKNPNAAFGSLDTYYSVFINDKLGKPKVFAKKFAFPFPTEATTFTGDYKTMFFTRESKFRDPSDATVKILKSDYIEHSKNRKTGWTSNFTYMPFNGDLYSCVQPSVSPDGDIIIFSSDMAGGLGKFDLYIVMNTKGQWGNPVNLGEQINTSEDELFPNLMSPGTLFFTSSGHKGFGGLDIFLVNLEDGGWSQSFNLGDQVNSTDDDIAFVVNPKDSTKALFSSNRNLYKKRFQIFSADMESGSGYLEGKNLLSYYGAAAVVIPLSVFGETEAETYDSTALESQLTDSSDTALAVQTTTSEGTSEVGTGTGVTAAIATGTAVALSDTEDTSFEETINTRDDEDVQAGEVDFRVQIISSGRSKGEFAVNIDGVDHTADEYFYKGAYRYTVGHFKSTREAVTFKNKCKEAGYNGSFVAAFINGERTTDNAVFRQY